MVADTAAEVEDVEAAQRLLSSDGIDYDEPATARHRTCSVLERLGFQTSGSEPSEWREQMEATWWYWVSPFAYCLAGGLLALRPEPLERGLPLFPWRCTALSVVSNGFLSYMADVESFGCRGPNRWKAVDRVFATTNTLLMCVVVLLSVRGHSHFAPRSVTCLGSGVVAGLFCKLRGSAALVRSDRDAYLLWHSLWHYTLPLGAILGQLVIHQPCDYAWHEEGSCAYIKALQTVDLVT